VQEGVQGYVGSGIYCVEGNRICIGTDTSDKQELGAGSIMLQPFEQLPRFWQVKYLCLKHLLSGRWQEHKLVRCIYVCVMYIVLRQCP
jgi:hypothetical protein